MRLDNVRPQIEALIDSGANVHRIRAETTALLGSLTEPTSRAPSVVPPSADGALSALARLHDSAARLPAARAAVESLVHDILVDRPDMQGPLANLPGPAGELVRLVLNDMNEPPTPRDPANAMRPGLYRDAIDTYDRHLSELRASIEENSVFDNRRAQQLSESARRVANRLDRAANALQARVEARRLEADIEKQVAEALRASGNGRAAIAEDAAERYTRQMQAYQQASQDARYAAGQYRQLSLAVDDLQLQPDLPTLAEAHHQQQQAIAAHAAYEQALRNAGPAPEALHSGVPSGNLPKMVELAEQLRRIPGLPGTLTEPHALEELLRSQFRQLAAPDGVIFNAGGVDVRIKLNLVDPVEVIDGRRRADQMVVGQFPQDGRPVTGVKRGSFGGSISLPLSDIVGGVVSSIVPQAKPFFDIFSAGVRGGVGTDLSMQSSGADFTQGGSVVDNRGPGSLYDLNATFEVSVRSGDYHLDPQWMDEVGHGGPGDSAWQSTTIGAADPGRMRLWVQHAYTERGPAHTVTLDPTERANRYPDGLPFPEHTVTGLTGLDQLSDALINQIPAHYRDAQTLEQIRTNVRAMTSQMGRALNEPPEGVPDDGYWFPVMHDGQAVGVVRIFAEVVSDEAGNYLVRPVGTSSNLMHQERLDVHFALANGGVSMDTSRSGGGNVGARLPSDTHLTPGGTLSGSFSRSDSDGMNVGGQYIHPLVGRYTGYTQAYDIHFGFDARFEGFNHEPIDPIHVEGHGLVRLPEHEAFEYGFPVDVEIVHDGTVEIQKYDVPEQGFDHRWPEWLDNTGTGNSTVHSLTGVEELYRQVIPQLEAEGLLPHRGPMGEFVFSTDPVVRAGQLHNLREISEQFTAASLESRFDHAVQAGGVVPPPRPDAGGVAVSPVAVVENQPRSGGAVLHLVRLRPHQAPEHVIFEIRIEMRSEAATFLGITDDERVVNLNIASESLGRSSGESFGRGVGVDGGLTPPKSLDVVRVGGGDASYGRDWGRSAGRIFANTLNEVQLVEAMGKSAGYIMPIRLVMERLGTHEQWFADGSAEVLISADLVDVSKRVLPGTLVANETPTDILSRATIVHMDTSGLAQASARVLGSVANENGPAIGQIRAFTSVRSMIPHIKELMEGSLGTELVIDPRGVRPTRGTLAMTATAGELEYLGQDSMVLGRINFTLGAHGTSFGTSHGIKLGGGGDAAVAGSAIITDIKPGGSWSEGGGMSRTDLTIVGREQLAISIDGALLFRTKLDVTVTGNQHIAPVTVEGRSVVFAIAKAESLRYYGEGRLPISTDHIGQIIDKWLEGYPPDEPLEEGRLWSGAATADRTIMARVVDRYYHDLAAADPGDIRLDMTDADSRAAADRLMGAFQEAFKQDISILPGANPLAAIHYLADAHLYPTHELMVLPEHLRESIGNTPIDSVSLTDSRTGRPTSLWAHVVERINQAAPGVFKQLPGLREGLRSQLGGTRWFAGGHPETMLDPEGLRIRIRVSGPLFDHDLTIRIRMELGEGPDAIKHLRKVPGMGFETQDYKYWERTTGDAANTGYGGGLTGDRGGEKIGGVVPMSEEAGGSVSRGHSWGDSLNQQKTRVTHVADFASGADQFGHQIRIYVDVERSLPHGQWQNPVLRLTDLLRRPFERSLSSQLEGEVTRLVPSAVVKPGQDVVPERLPDARMIDRLPANVVVHSSKVKGLLDAVTTRLSKNDLLGEHGVYRNRGVLENALTALTRNATLPEMVSPGGRTIVELPDPRNPGRFIEVRANVRMYDLHVTQTGIYGERLGMVDRFQRNTGMSAGADRLLPLSRSGSATGGWPEGPGGAGSATPGISGGTHAGDAVGATFGNRDETMVKERGPSSIVRTRFVVDIQLHEKTYDAHLRVTDGKTVMLARAALGHAHMQMFDEDLASVFHRIETQTVPRTWTEGPPVDRIFMILDRRDAVAQTFNLEHLVTQVAVDPRATLQQHYDGVADLVRNQMGRPPESGIPQVIRLETVGLEPGQAPQPGRPDPLVQARLIAVQAGVEVIVDVRTNTGVEHYRAMPDGSLHSTDPNRGFAIALGTLSPALKAITAERGVDLRAIYNETAGRRMSFADAVRTRLNIPDDWVPDTTMTEEDEDNPFFGTAVHYSGI